MHLATGDVGHVNGAYHVTFYADQTHAALSIQINNSMLEDIKKFILIINSSSLPNHVNIGNPNQTNITVDNHCKLRIVTYVVTV